MPKNLEDIIANTISEKTLAEGASRAKGAAKLIDAIKKYSESAATLSKIWEDAQNGWVDAVEDEEWAYEGDLPFDKSFDEHAADIKEWANKSIVALKRIK